jgi:PAS domain S-box-containing protein
MITHDYVEGPDTEFKMIVREAKEYAIFMISPEGTISTWNEGAQRMKQFTSEEAIGQNFRMLYRKEDQKDGRPERNILAALTDGRHEEQWWRQKKDGTLFWADAVMTPIYSSKGELIGLSKIVRDLSAVKRLQEDLHAASESAESASGLKTSFVANMSHEMRTPLTAILGFSELLKDPECPAQDRALAAEVIDRNGRALLALIEDILDLARIEAGNFEVKISKVPLDDLTREVIRRHEGRAREKGISIQFKMDKEVPECICSDPARLKQILTNILSNAVKFTERGEIALNIHATKTLEGRNGIDFIITDTGPGLNEDEKRGLFAPFAQADSTATRKFGGTGLGLALSRRFAQKLGGDVTLLDRPANLGCSFRITIADLDGSFPVEIESARLPTDSTETSRVSQHCEKVLVVDDAADNRILLRAILHRWGIECDLANDGAEGVEKALQNNYDLILMDIQMPILDGNQAVRKLRAGGYTRPIVAITAHAMNEERAKAFDSGVDDYLIKPVNLQRLQEILQTYAPKNRLLH